MDQRKSSGIFAAVAALLTALAVPAAASPVNEPDVRFDTEMVSAVQRDLGLTADEAVARLTAERRAGHTNLALRKSLGHRYAGGWLEDGKLVVAVTDTATTGAVRANGAKPALVTRSESQLDAVRARLDAGTAPGTVPGWYVDVPTNSVVVLSKAGAEAAAWSFVRASGVDTRAVRVVPSSESPRPLIDVIGGNAYFIGFGTRCSVGFSVNGGFVTAGHCGRTGATTSQPSGQFAGSSFPGNDYAWVRVNAGNTPPASPTHFSAR